MHAFSITNLPMEVIAELKKQFGDDIDISPLNPPKKPVTMAFDSALYDVIINHADGIATGLLTARIYDLMKKHNVKKTVINDREIVINNITVNQFVSIVEEEQSIGDSENNAKDE